jgi:hypothetical protein
LAVLGVPEKLGFSFGLLAFVDFYSDHADTATVWARIFFEEFFGLSGKNARYLSTLATLVLPAFFVLITLHDANGNPVPRGR